MAIRGTNRQEEIQINRRKKDTRRMGQKFTDAMNSTDSIMFLLLIFAFAGIAFTLFLGVPGSLEILIVILFFINRSQFNFKKKAFEFPYRVPAHAGLLDGSSQKGESYGEGIAYIGNEVGSKLPVYMGNSDLRTHMLVLGTTGSGKTEFLLGICANAITQNSGFIYVDGKGDVKLQKDMFRLARAQGREDDLLLINFMTSGRDFSNKQVDKVTNDMNLMANASSGMLIELIVGLMDDSSGGGGDMWKGRAIAFVAALTRPLVYLRDTGKINLSADSFIKYLDLKELENLLEETESDEGLKTVCSALRAYVLNIPGYQLQNKGKQDQKTLEQHGFITMQLLRVFNDLSFNYGHIFNTPTGDIDFYDVVLNRRILVVLLPALELAPDSLRMLGKLIVGNIKQLMSGCLGNKVEGLLREIIDSRPTNASIPFYCLLDEYGYYAVLGFAVAPAQARSLGFSIVFSAQDFSSLKKSSSEEADATWENTNLRAIGRITSGTKSETWERVHGAAGEADIAMMQNYNRKFGLTDEKLAQGDGVGVERRSRIDYDDFAGQQDGEFTFIVGKKVNKGKDNKVAVIRAMGFYTAGPTPSHMKLNDFLPVIPYKADDLPHFTDIKAKVEKHLYGEVSLYDLMDSDYQPTDTLNYISTILDLASIKIDELPVMSMDSAIQAGIEVYIRQERAAENLITATKVKPITERIKDVSDSAISDMLFNPSILADINKRVQQMTSPAGLSNGNAETSEPDMLDTTVMPKSATSHSNDLDEGSENCVLDTNTAMYAAVGNANLVDPMTIGANDVRKFISAEFDGGSLFKFSVEEGSETAIIDSMSNFASVNQVQSICLNVEGVSNSVLGMHQMNNNGYQRLVDFAKESTEYAPNKHAESIPEKRDIQELRQVTASLSSLALKLKELNLKDTN